MGWVLSSLPTQNIPGFHGGDLRSAGSCKNRESQGDWSEFLEWMETTLKIPDPPALESTPKNGLILSGRVFPVRILCALDG